MRTEIETQVCFVVGMMVNKDPETLSKDSQFGTDVTVDSLNAMMICAALEEKYAKAPSFTELCNMHSIGEIVTFIEENNA
ncbi:MAG: acyl carrier protein [Tyzzerella sp.]|nr:acyl carrier protein [Lachnospiraceae bacterium]MBP3663951.1 acyl carrier protein [Tyzzerella sp.]